VLFFLGKSAILIHIEGKREDIMDTEILIEPMTEKFILWRCLHFGPLTTWTIDHWPSDSQIDWDRYRKRNIPLLKKLTRTYGACAILARVVDRIVGQLRFYPRVIWEMSRAGEMCLQQDHPNGPADDFRTLDFPPLDQIEDRTLAVHCLMMGSPQQEENPFQRKGIGTRMVRHLIQWAKTKGWERIEVDAFEDIPMIYEMTGSAGFTFWQKLGFHIVDRHPHPHLQESNEFVVKLEEQAISVGISPERAKDRLVMRLDLT
jgi:GNAT superfamily N-acetyltransferase